MTTPYTTRPIKELTKSEFKDLLNGRIVTVSDHATDHLSEGQRKVFKEEELKGMVNKESPRKVYLQENGRYSAYYRRKDGFRKVIIELEPNKATIVTFIDSDELPKIRFENEKQ